MLPPDDDIRRTFRALKWFSRNGNGYRNDDTHQCVRSVCNPRCLANHMPPFIKHRRVPTNTLNTDLYLCSEGRIHFCGKCCMGIESTLCPGTRVCPISARVKSLVSSQSADGSSNVGPRNERAYEAPDMNSRIASAADTSIQIDARIADICYGVRPSPSVDTSASDPPDVRFKKDRMKQSTRSLLHAPFAKDMSNVIMSIPPHRDLTELTRIYHNSISRGKGFPIHPLTMIRILMGLLPLYIHNDSSQRRTPHSRSRGVFPVYTLSENIYTYIRCEVTYEQV